MLECHKIFKNINHNENVINTVNPEEDTEWNQIFNSNTTRKAQKQQQNTTSKKINMEINTKNRFQPLQEDEIENEMEAEDTEGKSSRNPKMPPIVLRKKNKQSSVAHKQVK